MRQFLLLFSCILTLNSLLAQNLESHRKSGEEFMQSGDLVSALSEFEKATTYITESQGNGIVFSYAGICAMRLNQDTKAINYFEQAIDRGFEDIKVFEWLGKLYKTHKNYNGQIEVYSKAAIMFPSSALSFNKNICSAYYYSKQYKKVTELAPLIIEDDEKDIALLGQYAGALQRLKKTADAKKVYEKLIDLDSENLNANIFLGNYYFQYGKALEAKENAAYQKIANPSRLQWADSNKKIENIRSNYFGKSVNHLERVYTIKPEDKYRKILFAAYTKLGNAAKAEQYK